MQKLNPNPSFCFIAPTEYLEYVYNQVGQYANGRQTHLVLAHLIMNGDQKYIDFYKNRSEAGDLIICDNSAFELGSSFDPYQLIEAAHKVKAHVLVLPDYPNQDWKIGVDSAEKWIDKFKQSGLKTAYVPQSLKGDTDGWIESYKYGANNPNIDVMCYSILGIPNALPNIPKPYARVVMTQILIRENLFTFDKHNHYLGSNAGIMEVAPLLKMKAMDSMDSSNPVWSAINYMEYNTDRVDYAPKRKSFLPHVDFNIQFKDDLFIAQILNKNIEITQDVINNTNNHFF